MAKVIFRSQPINYAAGRFSIPLDFLSRKGNRPGSRAVIERVLIRVAGQFDTDAGETLDGQDLHRILTLIEIKDGAGYRRNMTGPQAKLWAQSEYGNQLPDDGADLAAATANQTREIWFALPFSRPNDHGFHDCALPVDDVLGKGEIALTFAADADLPWAGGTGTIDPATVTTVFVECREEFDVVLHARDEIGFVGQDAAANLRLPVNGNLLRGLFLHLNGANGGTVVTTVTDLTIEALRLAGVPRIFLKNAYLLDHPTTRVAGDDMVANDRALPIVWPSWQDKQKHWPRIDGTLSGRFTTTMAAAQLCYHIITPKDRTLMASALGANGVTSGRRKLKTVAHTAQDPEGWGIGAVFMPEKVG